MSSPAGRFGSQATEACGTAEAEEFNQMQVAKFEPQELVKFLEFCAAKIHSEQLSRKSKHASGKIQ
jgi:hypothetical protein